MPVLRMMRWSCSGECGAVACSSPAMLWGMALRSRVRGRIDGVMTHCVIDEDNAIPAADWFHLQPTY
jgi:hypothetical protein